MFFPCRCLKNRTFLDTGRRSKKRIYALIYKKVYLLEIEGQVLLDICDFSPQMFKHLWRKSVNYAALSLQYEKTAVPNRGQR